MFGVKNFGGEAARSTRATTCAAARTAFASPRQPRVPSACSGGARRSGPPVPTALSSRKLTASAHLTLPLGCLASIATGEPRGRHAARPVTLRKTGKQTHSPVRLLRGASSTPCSTQSYPLATLAITHSSLAPTKSAAKRSNDSAAYKFMSSLDLQSCPVSCTVHT